MFSIHHIASTTLLSYWTFFYNSFAFCLKKIEATDLYSSKCHGFSEWRIGLNAIIINIRRGIRGATRIFPKPIHFYIRQNRSGIFDTSSNPSCTPKFAQKSYLVSGKFFNQATKWERMYPGLLKYRRVLVRFCILGFFHF